MRWRGAGRDRCALSGPGCDLHAESVFLAGARRGQAQTAPRAYRRGRHRRPGAARSSAGQAVPIRDRLPAVEEPPARRRRRAAPGRSRRRRRQPRSAPGRAGRASSWLRSGSASVIALVPVSGVDGAGDWFGRGQAGGAALWGVDRAAIPGRRCVERGGSGCNVTWAMPNCSRSMVASVCHAGLPIGEIRGLDVRGERGQPGGDRPDMKIVDACRHRARRPWPGARRRRLRRAARLPAARPPTPAAATMRRRRRGRR